METRDCLLETVSETRVFSLETALGSQNWEKRPLVSKENFSFPNVEISHPMPDLDFSNLPHRGWCLVDVVDLDDLIGSCQRCGTSIRYEHHCHHPMGIDAVVGCICCGDITGDYQRAKAAERHLKNFSLRRAKFLASKRWYQSFNGNLTIQYRGFRITVFQHGNGFKAVAGDTFSKKIYPTQDSAKIAAFNFLFKPA